MRDQLSERGLSTAELPNAGLDGPLRRGFERGRSGDLLLDIVRVKPCREDVAEVFELASFAHMRELT